MVKTLSGGFRPMVFLVLNVARSRQKWSISLREGAVDSRDVPFGMSAFGKGHEGIQGVGDEGRGDKT